MIAVTHPITSPVTMPVTEQGGSEFFYNLLLEDGSALLSEDGGFVVLE